MQKTIYAACALTALLTAWLLMRSYLQTRFRLLMWSALCFAGLTLNNVLLVLDRTVFLDRDLSTLRLAIALLSMCLLVGALVLERDS